MSNKPNMEHGNLIKVKDPLAARLKELSRETQIGLHEYVNEILEEYVRERRSGKPCQLPDSRFDDRHAGEWESVSL